MTNHLTRERQYPAEMKPVNHDCLFYSDDAVLLDMVTPFLATAMNADGAAIVIATEPHRKDLIHRLKIRGLDIDGATRRGTYVSFDAAIMLSAMNLNVASHPSILETFNGLIESVAKSTQQKSPNIAFFGECVGLLYTLGHMDAAIELETMGNELIERYKKYSLGILCGYPMLGWKYKQDFESICAEHSAVHIG